MAEESEFGATQGDVESLFRGLATEVLLAARNPASEVGILDKAMDLVRCSREGQDDGRILALEARVDELTEKVKRLLSATAHSVMDRPDRPGALGRKLG